MLKAKQLNVALNYAEKKLHSYMSSLEKVNPLSSGLGPLGGKSAGEGKGVENGPQQQEFSSVECGSMLERCSSLKKSSKK